jgi:deoxyhypusine synthase
MNQTLSQHDLCLSGRRILPRAIRAGDYATDLVDEVFFAYNSARLREASKLSLAGALTPAGLGVSCVVPLIEAGFVDWIVSTGANLYHDLHFAFNCKLCAGDFQTNDTVLFEAGVVRIYDVLLSRDECLLATDVKLRSILQQPEFQRSMGTAEFHHMLGEYAARAEEEAGLPHVSILAAAYRADVPVYTSSPGDSTIGLEVAAIRFGGAKLSFDPIIDVNETASFFFSTRTRGTQSGVVLLGGGSPKNFVLQTAPHCTDSLGLDVKGHDYFLQITDARADTGGLSGATPCEAVSWGKVDPEHVPDAVVCYCDTTIALPVLTSYALTQHSPRQLRRLYRVRQELTAELQHAYLAQSRRVPH